jgi:uncharacterized membrane protein
MASTSEQERLTGRQRALVIRIDRFAYWISKHWLAVFNAFVSVYVALPLLAPVMMKAGWDGPARVIYTAYSPMCHQMAQRSFFLFGDQPVYPSRVAETTYTPIEAYMGRIPEFAGVTAENWPAFFSAARRFRGNEQMGYKLALCERDISIYGFVLVGGLLYAMLRNRFRIRPLPILAFILIGVLPIALDGFSQLFSYMLTPVSGGGSSPLVLRESPPLLRSLTGAWFGFLLVWLAYPRVEEGMRTTERELGAKLERAMRPAENLSADGAASND